MSATEVHTAGGDASVGKLDLKLEVQIIPVSEVDRAKEFYERLGFRLDADDAPLPGLRRRRGTVPRLAFHRRGHVRRQGHPEHGARGAQ